MGGGDQVLIEIIIFAMIAAFLVHRLRSVLGRRHGEERQRQNPLARREAPTDAAERDNVIQLPERGRAPVIDADVVEEPQSLAANMDRIHKADPSFDEKDFLRGARQAFEMIVTAFAKGEADTLRPLLAPNVFNNFNRAIEARAAAGETLETQVVKITDADVAEARLEGRNAILTIRFVSEQINVTRDANGAIVDGDPDESVEVIDLWTFARDTRSRDPNWALVETRAPT